MEKKMDGSTPEILSEHSDSDSCESWTLLENNGSYTNNISNESKNRIPKNEESGFATDQDEDTDGISIISDSDLEMLTPCEQVNNEPPELNHPADQQNKNIVLVHAHPTSKDNDECIRCDEFGTDSSGKLKTYVHKRNKKLSTVLNIIVLGSVITAAGVAFGHMWGVRDDCAQQSPSSLNKILSNLYKLQEENAYLRNKVKELTLTNNVHYRKGNTEKQLAFKQKCRKVFEESLGNRDAKTATKCVDPIQIDASQDARLVDPQFEQDFVMDLNKLKNFYNNNKSWLNAEVVTRLKNEELSLKAMEIMMKINKSNNHKKIKDEKSSKQFNSDFKYEIVPDVKKITTKPSNQIKKNENDTKNKKISYADSLKSEKKDLNQKNNKAFKHSLLDTPDIRTPIHKKRQIKNVHQDSYLSDDEIEKDNRHTSQKHKLERKKHDRQKSYKKLKLKNKYEQWQMKGGYMKDYDDISYVSSHDSIPLKDESNLLDQKFTPDTYTTQIIDTKDSNKSIENDDTVAKKIIDKVVKREKSNEKNGQKLEDNWYEKRVALRMEARKKLEQELFGINSPNNSGWYFRRMQKREQCRAKPDNTTYKKALKKNLNFKTKR